jgi:hypothetical protein
VLDPEASVFMKPGGRQGGIQIHPDELSVWITVLTPEQQTWLLLFLRILWARYRIQPLAYRIHLKKNETPGQHWDKMTNKQKRFSRFVLNP